MQLVAYNRVILHCDVNNFYANCERIFQLKWRGRPVVVISNNDGCLIALSLEAKAMGLKMGDPFYQVKEFCDKNGVIYRSSNYALYGEFSDRFMRIASRFAPLQEVYSVDESFLELTGIPGCHTQRAQELRATVKQYISLPICCGIASTKTLAKLADYIAKKNPQFNGVCNFFDIAPNVLDEWMGRIPAGEIWGVGKRLAVRLENMGIKTVLDLKRVDPEFMRQQFSIVMEKTIRELNGVVCIEMEEIPPPKKEIISSRSFGYRVTDLPSLEESVSLYMSRAAEKLRAQQSYANTVNVYIMTGEHEKPENRYNDFKTVVLPAPTDNTLQLVAVALWGLRQIYKPGFRYQKSGVGLSGIVPASGQQGDLLGYQPNDDRSARLMLAMDSVNKRMGKYMVRVGSQGFRAPWAMKQEYLSQNYMSDIKEILVVN